MCVRNRGRVCVGSSTSSCFHLKNCIFQRVFRDFPLHLLTLTEFLGAFSNILRNSARQRLIKFWYANMSLLYYGIPAFLLSISSPVLVLLCVMLTVTWKDVASGRSR